MLSGMGGKKVTGREFLRKVRTLNLQVRALEDELLTAQQSIDGLSGMRYDKDRVQGGEPPDLADKLTRVMELRRDINADWDKLIDQRAKARVYIEYLHDYRYIYLLKERYICGKTWLYIAEQMHLDRRWVFRLHNAALDAFDKIYQDFDHLTPPDPCDIIKL